MKRGYSPFRSQRSLPYLFRYLNMSLVFFLYVSVVILLIAVSTIRIGDVIVPP